MKIESKFKDYYDSALGSFMESEVVFRRKQEHILLSKNEVPSLGKDFYQKVMVPKEYLNKNSYLKDSPRTVIMLGFCGNWYYGVFTYGTSGLGEFNRCYLNNLSKKENDEIKSKLNKELEDKIFKDYMEYNDNLKYFEFNEIKKMMSYGSIGRDFFDLMGKDAGKYFAANKEVKDPSKTEFWKDEIFEKYGPVILVLYPHEIKAAGCQLLEPHIHIFTNPILKNFKFAQVKDNFTALYEINNWIDSHARPDEAIVPVGDDITRLQAYGFDKKTSFRKAKEKK